MRRRIDRRRGATAALVVGLLAGGCTGGTERFETAQDLFDAAGGETWCGGELELTLAPWVGRCGPEEDRAVIGIAVDEGELAASLDNADEGLAVLVTEDPDAPGWQIRSGDVERLRAAQERIGGVLLEDDEAIAEYLEG